MRKYNKWDEATRLQVTKLLSDGLQMGRVAKQLNLNTHSLYNAVHRWRRQGYLPSVEFFGGHTTRAGRHNSVPLVTKLRWLRDYEQGIGPLTPQAFNTMMAYIKDPRVRTHRVYHAHLALNEPVPPELASAFEALSLEAKGEGDVGMKAGRLPVPRLTWRP